jgi:class 3 adenylate cyclase
LDLSPRRGRILNALCMEPERRPVTVLFADLVGFTAFTERSGDEAAFVLVEAVRRLITGIVEAHGGTVNEVTGDGIVALFGVPVALEDGPLRACRAALSIQQRLAAQGDDFEVAHGARPQLRISINTGVVIVGSVEDGPGLAVFGDAVNTAARLQGLAPPGAVLLSETVHKSVHGLVDGASVGLYLLKGKARPQPAYRLEAIREGVPRFAVALARGLSPHVGRKRELKRLGGILRGNRRRLRIVDIVGESGAGKSRLLHELFSRPVEAGTLLAGSCPPDGRAVPFLPMIGIVRACFDIAPSDDREVVARKLSHGLAALDLLSPQNLILLGTLLGFDTAAEWQERASVEPRVADLLQQLLEACCRRSALVLLLEDLQWIDGATEELLARLLRSADASRLALVHTRRPDYRPPWIDHPRARTFRLAPLTEAETCHIARHRLDGCETPEELARLIAGRAGGNPLFAEEVAGLVLERRVPQPGGEGREDDATTAAEALPLGVQSLLAARIDGLDRWDQAMLRAAAVIGCPFDTHILSAVIGDDGRVARRLAVLAELHLLQQGETPGALVFTHPLMRDMLYENLLAPQRAALHLKIAAAIERRGGDRRIEVATPRRSSSRKSAGAYRPKSSADASIDGGAGPR